MSQHHVDESTDYLYQEFQKAKDSKTFAIFVPIVLAHQSKTEG
jgi:hypothetical protein